MTFRGILKDKARQRGTLVITTDIKHEMWNRLWENWENVWHKDFFFAKRLTVEPKSLTTVSAWTVMKKCNFIDHSYIGWTNRTKWHNHKANCYCSNNLEGCKHSETFDYTRKPGRAYFYLHVFRNKIHGVHFQLQDLGNWMFVFGRKQYFWEDQFRFKN